MFTSILDKDKIHMLLLLGMHTGMPVPAWADGDVCIEAIYTK